MSAVIIGDIIPYTQATAILNQTVFMTNWTANYPSDVVVYQTPFGDEPDDVTQILPYPAGYSVAFIGDQQEAQVTLVTPAGAGDIITITRMTPADRENLYTNTNFTPSMLNNDFGILTLVDQQAQLVDQLIGPRYNYSAIIENVVDTILPILPPNQVWAKNTNDTAIIAVPLGTASGLNATNPALPYVASADGPFVPGHIVVAGDVLGTIVDGGLNPGTGTVTSISTTGGITGGPITTTGTISLEPIDNGQLLIGSSGISPVPNTLTAGTNISILNAPGSITISTTGAAGFSWNVVTGTSNAMLTNNGYIANNGSQVSLALPLVSSVGDELSIVGQGAGGWKITQGSGQSILVSPISTTVGVIGSLASASANDSIDLICIVANTTWTSLSGPQSTGLTYT